MEKISDFSALADRERFIVAYPEALEKNWTDGRGVAPAEHHGVDDVAVTRDIIAESFPIDSDARWPMCSPQSVR